MQFVHRLFLTLFIVALVSHEVIAQESPMQQGQVEALKARGVDVNKKPGLPRREQGGKPTSIEVFDDDFSPAKHVVSEIDPQYLYGKLTSRDWKRGSSDKREWDRAQLVDPATKEILFETFVGEDDKTHQDGVFNRTIARLEAKLEVCSPSPEKVIFIVRVNAVATKSDAVRKRRITEALVADPVTTPTQFCSSCYFRYANGSDAGYPADRRPEALNLEEFLFWMDSATLALKTRCDSNLKRNNPKLYSILIPLYPLDRASLDSILARVRR